MKIPKSQTTIKEDSGKLLQDIGKLIFGSMFLGGVLRGELPQNILIIVRFTGEVTFYVAGLIKKKKKKNIGDSQPTEKQEK
jgi:hypothetical protein